MLGRLAETARPRSPVQWLLGSAYALGVAGVAAVGFVDDSTPTILFAAVLSLPASVIAVPGYYVTYGLLALLPGANPSESGSGSGSCTEGGDCTVTTTGDPADWFQATTDVLGVLALTLAALLNGLTLMILLAGRRRARKV